MERKQILKLAAHYLHVNNRLGNRTEIPADCLGIQVVSADPAKLAVRNEFFAKKKAERVARKAEEDALLVDDSNSKMPS